MENSTNDITQKLLPERCETSEFTIMEALHYYGKVRYNSDYYCNSDKYVNWYSSALSDVLENVRCFKDFNECYFAILYYLDKKVANLSGQSENVIKFPSRIREEVSLVAVRERKL